MKPWRTFGPAVCKARQSLCLDERSSPKAQGNALKAAVALKMGRASGD
jgi:hypothetical protein